MIRSAALVLSLLLPGFAFAQAPRPAPAAPAPAPAAPALDPAQAASKAAYERLAEPERKAIQNDLIWTGDFNGVAGGEFGRRTYDAMLAFERRSQGTPDGILAPPERAALKRDADAARAVLRFADISDPATGIRIGMPQALLTQRVAVNNGVVHRRADGAVSLQLSQLPPAQSFAELFEQLRQDGPGRKVTYRLQRPDWFVVSGEE
ncbi:MAG: peptidoglycan-binding domain-containing protein, partial [Caldilineaceae bacterium]